MRKCLENRSCLVIDKVIPALASVTQTGPGSCCLCMLNFKDVALRNTGVGAVVWSRINLLQPENPSLGNKYPVAMETLKVDERWINQNTVNPFYELPKESSVKWALWSVSSYSLPITQEIRHGCTMLHIYYSESYVYASEWQSFFASKASSYKHEGCMSMWKKIDFKIEEEKNYLFIV